MCQDVGGDGFKGAQNFKQTKNGKWRFIRLGSGKQNDKGGFDIWLDALPIADANGDCRISLQPKREDQSGGQYHRDPRDIDDEVPF